MTKGILAFGAYIPWRRLPRKAIADTHGWFNPALKGQAKGERAFCNWDEDAVTMAVEAARDALAGRDRGSIAALRFASTTFPFLDRLHSGIVAGALSLDDGVSTIDVAATQRAGTSALIEALGSDSETLVVAAEKRDAKAASPVEMTSGDGAAAILVGEGKPIARLLAKASRTADFVDHFRSVDNQFDYQWEERWIRDAGYMPIVPPTIKRCLEEAKVAAKDVTHFCMPATLARVANSVAKAAGIDDKAICDPLHANCGDTGAAHALLLLAATLEKAKPGEKILVVGFGQGADALLFEVTPEIANRPKNLGVAGHLARRKEETSYGRYLAFNDLIELERGMRSETDKGTPLSAMWRNRETVTSFTGGKCSKCGTLQFPKTDICVNPNCNAIGTQEPHGFADMGARIKSYTADRLTYSPDPPSCYGMIEFEEGGRVMIDFTDIDADALKVGQPMQMMFRIKDIDTRRGFRRYYWKAAPVAAKALRRDQPWQRASRTRSSSRHGLLQVRRALGQGGRQPDGGGLHRGHRRRRHRHQADRCGLARPRRSRSSTSASRRRPLAVALRLPFIPVTRVENYCASGTEAFRGAVYAVASGAADIALAMGVEKLKDTGYGGLPQRGRGPLNDMVNPNASAPGSFAQLAAAYRAKHKVDPKDLKRRHGAHLRQEPRQRRRATPRRICATRSRSTPCSTRRRWPSRWASTTAAASATAPPAPSSPRPRSPGASARRTWSR